MMMLPSQQRKMQARRRVQAAKGRTSLAVVRRGRPHSELLAMIDELKSERQELTDEVRSLTIAKDHLQGKLNKGDKLELRLRGDIERLQHQVKEMEGECLTMRQSCGRLEREQKQREISSKADLVRLTRQEEQLSQLKGEERN